MGEGEALLFIIIVLDFMFLRARLVLLFFFVAKVFPFATQWRIKRERERLNDAKCKNRWQYTLKK